MLRKSLLTCGRKKGGQTAWTPNTGGAMNSSPKNLISNRETMALMYRPLPSNSTVDYEEDFYNSIMLHRECITKKGRAALAGFHDVPLAYSDTELREGKKQIANVMNKHSHVDPLDESNKHSMGISNVESEALFDPETETLRSVQYLFNEKRMQYCTRFVRGLRRLFEGGGGGGASTSGSDMDDPHMALEHTQLHALMEVSAILFGASSEEAEDYLRQFGLGRKELDSDCEAQRAATESAISTVEAYNAAVKMGALTNSNANQSTAELTQGSTSPAPAIPITADNVDFVTTYAAYIDFASGKSPTPIPSPVLGTLNASNAPTTSPSAASAGQGLIDRHLLSSRLQWRTLLDALVAEDYHHLSQDDMTHLINFNNYLHTHKFMEYKVGDCVRMIVGAKHHDFGASMMHTPGGDMGATSRPNNPANRGAGRVTAE